MPIQYGTVQCGSILGGLLFYREFEYMVWWQYLLTFVGLVMIVGGIAFGAVPQPRGEVGDAAQEEVDDGMLVEQE